MQKGNEIPDIVFWLLFEGVFGVFLWLSARWFKNGFLLDVTKGWTLLVFSILLIILTLTIIIGKMLQ